MVTIEIKQGTHGDVDAIETLYNELNDYLACHTNYAGWRKGIYPTRETAATGIACKTLYIAKRENRLVGSIILNHEPEMNYDSVRWPSSAAIEDVFVIHTLAVHPVSLKNGVGKQLLQFSYDMAQKNKMKALRLDVNEQNKPAITLYENFGFTYVDTIDIGLGGYGLPWFRVYEMAVELQ